MPAETRGELGMEEGTALEARKEEGGVPLVVKPSIEPCKAVGRDEYERIIRELDGPRRRWRRPPLPVHG
ncbi:MAG: hypothetical protein JRN73_02390 [Nitrososphaerota archaeon]|nr:hypothetical protein [Nitrososphaerota archaeon]MDG7017187.1 hypothetical protein [Nitrososphaerota archaeon]